MSINWGSGLVNFFKQHSPAYNVFCHSECRLAYKTIFRSFSVENNLTFIFFLKKMKYIQKKQTKIAS